MDLLNAMLYWDENISLPISWPWQQTDCPPLVRLPKATKDRLLSDCFLKQKLPPLFQQNSIALVLRLEVGLGIRDAVEHAHRLTRVKHVLPYQPILSPMRWVYRHTVKQQAEPWECILVLEQGDMVGCSLKLFEADAVGNTSWIPFCLILANLNWRGANLACLVKLWIGLIRVTSPPSIQNALCSY